MRVLLHMCCGPCSVYPVSVLQKEGITINGFFFNPNIHPEEEYLKRKQNVQVFSRQKNIQVDYFDEYDIEAWKSFEGTVHQRCGMCYTMRVKKAASYAAEKGFDAFTTTLLVSPYQKHNLIIELCEEFAGKYGIVFYYRDFRSGFRQGQQKAREMGLYRQKYCGCINSLKL